MFVRVTRRPQMLRRLTKQMETFPVGGFLYSQTNMFRVDVTRSSCYFMLFVLGAVGFYHNNSNLSRERLLFTRDGEIINATRTTLKTCECQQADAYRHHMASILGHVTLVFFMKHKGAYILYLVPSEK